MKCLSYISEFILVQPEIQQQLNDRKVFQSRESHQQLRFKTSFKGVLLSTETQMCFRFQKKLTSVFLDIRKLQKVFESLLR